MNPATLSTTSQFFTAAASYYGVPVDQLLLDGQLGRIDGVFSITLHIALTPDDLIGITKRMAMLDKERAGKALDDFLGEPRAGIYAELSRAIERTRRAGMSETQSAEFDAEGLTGAWRGVVDTHDQNTDEYGATAIKKREPNSEGVAGRTVVHADVPEEDGDAGLPAAVWMHQDDLAAGQANLVSDRRYIDGSNEYLLQRDMLNDEQKAKYGVAS